MKYTHESHISETNDIIQGFKIQVSHLKSENRNLNTRLEKTLRDDLKKLESERSGHMATKEKLRVAEERLETVDIQNENLLKKVSFFKNQT
jgi:predicted  nucleic acid-binding Zn-ribbon protein